MNVLEEAVGLVSEKLIVFKTIASIVKLETRLAGLSVLPCLMTACMLLLVLLGIWFLAMGLACYLMSLVLPSMLLAILSVLFLNIFLFMLLLRYLVFNLKKMSFQKTRAYLLQREKQSDESFKKNDHSRASDTREKIAVSPSNSERP